MPIPPTSPQDNNAILVTVLIVAALCTIYWRIALRLIVVAFIAFAAYGLIMGLHVR